MVKGRRVYDPLTNVWSTGHQVKDNQENWYLV